MPWCKRAVCLAVAASLLVAVVAGPALAQRGGGGGGGGARGGGASPGGGAGGGAKPGPPPISKPSNPAGVPVSPSGYRVGDRGITPIGVKPTMVGSASGYSKPPPHVGYGSPYHGAPTAFHRYYGLSNFWLWAWLLHDLGEEEDEDEDGENYARDFGEPNYSLEGWAILALVVVAVGGLGFFIGRRTKVAGG